MLSIQKWIKIKWYKNVPNYFSTHSSLRHQGILKYRIAENHHHRIQLLMNLFRNTKDCPCNLHCDNTDHLRCIQNYQDIAISTYIPCYPNPNGDCLRTKYENRFVGRCIYVPKNTISHNFYHLILILYE